MARWQALIIAVCLAFGLAGCSAPLKPDHGYPAEWGEPVALSRGFPEIIGTYANQGTSYSTESGFGHITLTSLIPQGWPSGQPKGDVPNPPCTDCVVLQIRPGTKWNPLPGLRATIPGVERASEFDVDVASDERALLYLLTKSASEGVLYGQSQTRVSLTIAADRSLIARIEKTDTGLIVVVPYTSARYVWARFGRIGQ